MDLTTKKRDHMPAKDFAGKGKSFPDSDPAHARLAEAMAVRSYNAGNISKSQEASIESKAHRALLRETESHVASHHSNKAEEQ